MMSQLTLFVYNRYELYYRRQFDLTHNIITKNIDSVLSFRKMPIKEIHLDRVLEELSLSQDEVSVCISHYRVMVSPV